ncbi:hypothetical protein [Lacrimispora celerecrescens]|uniref:Nitrogen regulatory protein P-II family n=1 Tax=[Clostridium] celerecrescens 18A TaxID=1286362 RepID=A0A2M8YZU3_9FIRM|nr:hypothetical protein [Lacrimispora celerecrescens]PJJ26716.1 hypothetical protein H171_0157 [[Clostridium] celerecrescens 18A]
MTSNRKINWITIIVARGKGEKAASVFREHHQELLLITRGHGTASSAIRDCLGFDEPEKDLVIGIVEEAATKRLLSALHEKLELEKPGYGIVFTIPLSGISAAASSILETAPSAGDMPTSTDYHKEDRSMSDTIRYELIAAVINTDLSAPIMEAARNAGCKGGTLVKAREALADDSKKLFGLTLSSEKEILLILVPLTDKQAVLKSICETVLKETGEHAIAFSLPVDEVAGLSTLEK